MKDGRKYSVRENRMKFFMPDIWLKFKEALGSKRAKFTAEVLIQLGCRINEARHIENRDVDYERNTLTLRVTKCKAKKGETKGKPRTIPINSDFAKQLKKYFSTGHSKLNILSTCGFNIALKKSLQKIGVKDYYMYSAHNIRKSHGFWLKVMSHLRLMDIDAAEICLRLGHDFQTYLLSYGSPGILNNQDVMIVQQVLGDLYQARR